ncbi:MAG TPA: DUF6531 domain-containing protein, partial [Gammaproteobacteria bacterium]|nr:DUF6531 domain-containing protein [Gammaproteobacteria bacterium]
MLRIAVVSTLILIPSMAPAAYSCDPGAGITTIGTEAVAMEKPQGPNTPIKYYLATLECRGGTVQPIVHTKLRMTPNQVAGGAGGVVNTYNSRGLATTCDTAYYFIHKFYTGTLTNSLGGQSVTVDFGNSRYPVGKISESPFNDTFTGSFKAKKCSRCTEGKQVTGPVEDLNDGCYNGCEVDNLSPTQENQWVRTLEGENTGAVCTEPSGSEGVNKRKMLACGTGGSSYKTKTAHPIDFSIGNKFFIEADYRGSGTFPIVFSRTYNSYDLGWRFAYTQRIERVSNDHVVAHRPGGQSFDFRLANGQWRADPDVTARLKSSQGANGGDGWTYVRPDHTTERYDAHGRLTAIRNPAGLTQKVSHSDTPSGQLLTVTDPQGHRLRIALNAAGTLAKRITDPQGRTTEYHYRDGLMLTRVVFPDGNSKKYLYGDSDRPWLITGIIDEDGHRSHTVDYDARGRAVMSELAGGAERVDVSYNDDGTTTLTNALGKQTTYHFQTIQGVRKVVREEGQPSSSTPGTDVKYAYDDNGFLVEKTDAKGVTTRYKRSEHGLELSRTEAVGTPQEHTVTTRWDREIRKPLVITDGNRETRYTYDAEGRSLSRTVTDRKTGASRTTRYAYNSQGLLKSVNGPREDVADVTTYRYDAQGRLSGV